MTTQSDLIGGKATRKCMRVLPVRACAWVEMDNTGRLPTKENNMHTIVFTIVYASDRLLVRGDDAAQHLG